jgi:hypothetical protein
MSFDPAAASIEYTPPQYEPPVEPELEEAWTVAKVIPEPTKTTTPFWRLNPLTGKLRPTSVVNAKTNIDMIIRHLVYRVDASTRIYIFWS